MLFIPEVVRVSHDSISCLGKERTVDIGSSLGLTASESNVKLLSAFGVKYCHLFCHGIIQQAACNPEEGSLTRPSWATSRSVMSDSGFPVHGILQARILEWVAISSSRASSWPRDQTHVSCISCINRWIPYYWADTFPASRTFETLEVWNQFCCTKVKTLTGQRSQSHSCKELNSASSELGRGL